MTWHINAPQGNETAKTRWRAVPYTRGKGLDLGCGPQKLFETRHVIGVDNNKDLGLFGIQANPNIDADVTDLSFFASRSVDFVFSSHVLEHIEWEKVPETLRNWCRLIKKKGHLVMYLPLSGLYPDPDFPGANPDHRWAVTYDRIDEAMQTVSRDWDLVHYEVCGDSDEYSAFWAYRMTSE